MIDLLEESLEMSGASILLYALVEYAAAPERELRISFCKKRLLAGIRHYNQ